MTRAHGSGGLLIRSVRLPTEEDAAQEQYVGGDEKAIVSCYKSKPFQL